jgi:hypothetical protein
MVISTGTLGQNPGRVEVPQYGLGAILIMFAWPAAWYTLLIYVSGLCFAFAAGPLGSLPLAMTYHWVGNFLFQLIFLILAAIGAG